MQDGAKLIFYLTNGKNFPSSNRLMRRCLIVGFLCLFGLSVTACANAASSIQDLTIHSLSYFREISSGSCSATLEMLQLDNVTFQKVADIDYGIQGAKLFFDYVQVTTPWSERFTYDGKQSMYFNRTDDRSLTIGNKKFLATTMEGLNVLLEPFSFLYGDHGASRTGFFLSLQELSNANNWKILNKAEVQPKQKLGNERCLILDLPGSIDPILKISYKVRAWFDIDNGYYPIQFQCIAPSGKLVRQYTVLSMGFLDSGKKLPYPKVAEDTNFDEVGNIHIQSKITVVNVKTNVEINDSEFTIEPMLANEIKDDDGDSQIWIRLPHSVNQR